MICTNHTRYGEAAAGGALVRERAGTAIRLSLFDPRACRRLGPQLHNLYPVQYHCGALAAAPRAVRFTRSGWTGSTRCSPVVWGGDPSVDWASTTCVRWLVTAMVETDQVRAHPH